MVPSNSARKKQSLIRNLLLYVAPPQLFALVPLIYVHVRELRAAGLLFSRTAWLVSPGYAWLMPLHFLLLYMLFSGHRKQVCV